jgi:Organic radical activating enzymes
VNANLIEIFSSLQGEGPYVGRPMAFVRFQDCALSCKFCDTPASFQKHGRYRVESEAFSSNFQSFANPVAPARLSEHVAATGLDFVSLTGGEPLQHGDFLAEWLPELRGRAKLLLETNGVLPRALGRVLPHVDVVSMDMKLPSVTGMRAYWEEHEEFLTLAREKEVYVKVVVSTPTDLAELKQAIDIVERVAPEIPFILQPVTPAWQVKEEIPLERLKHFYQVSCEHLSDVRVIPQLHAKLGIL